jgi:mannose-6-phosphate isomerase-like protein (cupin superfamily)
MMYIAKLSQLPPEITNPSGEIVQEILGIQNGDVLSHSLAKVTLPPGKKSVKHFHADSEESYLILSGKATVILDEKTLTLTEGDALLIAPGEVHQIINKNEADLLFLAICVPAWQPEDSFTVEEGEVA